MSNARCTPCVGAKAAAAALARAPSRLAAEHTHSVLGPSDSRAKLGGKLLRSGDMYHPIGASEDDPIGSAMCRRPRTSAISPATQPLLHDDPIRVIRLL
jgi:hypothetical protein